MAKLVIHDQEQPREVILQESNPVGRHSSNFVRLQDSLVSKEHCLILKDHARGYVLQDLGSRNGSFVNSRRVEGDQLLKDGDVITLGTTRCRFVADKEGDLLTTTDDFTKAIVVRKGPSAPRDYFLPEDQIRDEKVLRADYEKLRVGQELQRDIGLDLNIDRTFRRILDRTFEVLDCDRTAIITFSDLGEIEIRAFKTRQTSDRIIISTTLVRHVQSVKAGVITADALADERFDAAHSIVAQRIRSSMAVPIMYDRELLGIMIIDSSSAVRAYAEKDLDLFMNIARQTAQYMKIEELVTKVETEAVTRARFQRLLSPDLAELVVSGKLAVEKGGEVRSVTVLFADIRGFTSLCEGVAAPDILTMLNDYFEVLVEVAFSYQGTVDKFIGDSLMVVWGAPVSHPDDPVRAVKAAVDMQRELRAYNAARKARGQVSLGVGVGINTGTVVAGYIGSTQTMSYSVIGDAVNIAFRLCAAAEAGQIIISEETHRHVLHEFNVTELPSLKVKGKTAPLKAYSIIGGRT